MHSGLENKEVREENLGDELETLKLFVVRGKPNFSDLSLKEYGWKRINTPSIEQQKFFENTPGYKDYKETIIYQGPQGITVVQANYRKDKHKVAIYLNNGLDYSNKMNDVKFMFEREWEYKLEESEDLNKANDSGLEEKISSN